MNKLFFTSHFLFSIFYYYGINISYKNRVEIQTEEPEFIDMNIMKLEESPENKEENHFCNAEN